MEKTKNQMQNKSMLFDPWSEHDLVLAGETLVGK